MIYFDNGATTFPKPRSVVNAVNYAITQIGANPGRGGHKMAMKASEVLYDCRKNAAELFDIDNPENVIITNNCTTALNTVIKGILKSGDHAVISSYEHNAVVLIVSEETGVISLAINGVLLRNFTRDELVVKLESLLLENFDDDSMAAGLLQKIRRKSDEK